MNLLDALRICKGITNNSKEVREGYIFFAIKGSSTDGNIFIDEAFKKGAFLTVTDQPIRHPRVTRVKNARKAFAVASNLFYGFPSEGLNVVGVTGTNGKTTVTYIIEGILKEAGFPTGAIGTINYRIKEDIISEGRTTPPSHLWFSILKRMKEEGVRYVSAEVSSHALDQERIRGTSFDAVIFTNLSQDHLDYHKNMEEYFKAKARLFKEYSYNMAYINVDDPYGKKIYEELKKAGKDATGFGSDGDTKILAVHSTFKGTNVKIYHRGKEIVVNSPLVGEFQAYNITAGVSYCLDIGIDEKTVKEAVKKIRVPGRFERIEVKGRVFIIDYAHTPDALRNVLEAINRIREKGRIITVFGAGGNRDKGKRPLMGRVAEALSDIVILTSDNPRNEDPLSIIGDILKGISNKDKVFIKEDREEAIHFSFKISKEGDIILVAGKGHEDYQEIKDKRIKFSDRDVIIDLIK